MQGDSKYRNSAFQSGLIPRDIILSIHELPVVPWSMHDSQIHVQLNDNETQIKPNQGQIQPSEVQIQPKRHKYNPISEAQIQPNEAQICSRMRLKYRQPNVAKIQSN